MKTHPYNKESAEGRRLFKMLDLQFNPGTLNVANRSKSFETYDVPSVAQCRANKASFLFPSNLAGIKRPQVRIESDVESAWGDFAEGITTLDFTHDGQELPLIYTQPIEDDTMKLLIDAGLYRDEQFEELMSKLMADELFDAESDMRVSHLDVGQDGKQVPVLLVEPVDVVHIDHDPSERTTITDLLKRSARLAIELRKEGVKSDELVAPKTYDQDSEVFIADSFRDAIAAREEAALEEAADKESGFVASSELLDQEIDVTDKLKGSLGFDYTSEDDRIRDLKEREWDEARDEHESGELAPSNPDLDDSFDQGFKDISDMDVDDLPDDDYPVEDEYDELDDLDELEPEDEDEDELER